MRVLLIIPPMTQLNTPYPATAQLLGYLRKVAHDGALGQDLVSSQVDLALELVLRLFSREGIERLRGAVLRNRGHAGASAAFFLENYEQISTCIDPAVRYLQGRDPSLAFRIVQGGFLPEGPRFPKPDASSSFGDPLGWAFGALGLHDRAKHLCSLFLDELADVVRESVDPRFEFARYGEKLARSAASFTPLHEALEGEGTLVDTILDELAADRIKAFRPDVVAITAPFAGNVYGAFRIARQVRKVMPSAKTVLGGGFVNTELRELAEPRVFDYFDYVVMDDGERPLLSLLQHLAGLAPRERLVRTFVREAGKVRFLNDPAAEDVAAGDTGTPTYDGLPLDRYLSILEMLNPMHRLWSDGRWNKLAVAHGCYWRKCSFCDVSLDYIARYQAAGADKVVERMSALMKETEESGFHFVDEAAPPAGLKAIAERIVEQEMTVSWWGNIRFDKAFTPDLTALLARSGCVAVSGGLEVASDRLLKLMQKGVTVEQVARVTRAFTDAGIMVHAYLMYGFPTQTVQETIDSLERVRQLFAEGCLQSAYWHRFSATAHSPIGRYPGKYGIRILSPKPGKSAEPLFARNDLEFEDPTGCDEETKDWLGEGLRKATYNYMQGAGLDLDVRFWFDAHGASPRTRKAPRAPKSKVPKGLIRSAIRSGLRRREP